MEEAVDVALWRTVHEQKLRLEVLTKEGMELRAEVEFLKDQRAVAIEWREKVKQLAARIAELTQELRMAKNAYAESFKQQPDPGDGE